MEYLVSIEGIPQTILPAAITSFTFTTDISSLYSTCRLVIQDCLQVYFSNIRLGQPAIVTFLDEDKTYVNNMAVLSYHKVPQAVGLATDQIEIRLISKLYFDLPLTYTACHSNNVGAIISSILSSKFPQISAEFKDIAPTTDVPAPRYQINKRYQDFMMSLLPFASIDDLPVFLFTDHKGVLHLKGVSEILKSDIADASLLVTGRDADVEGHLNGNVSAKRLYARSYRVVGDGSNSSSRIKGYSAAVNFLDPYDTRDVTVYRASESYNPQSLRESPHSSISYGWEVAPQDAKNNLIWEGFRRNKSTFAIDATVNDFAGGDLNVMSGVRVVIPYHSDIRRPDGTLVVLGDGLYIVTGLQYIVEAPKNLKFTRMTLLQASC